MQRLCVLCGAEFSERSKPLQTITIVWKTEIKGVDF